MQLLNVLLNNVHLVSQRVHTVLLADSVQRHDVVGLLLELFVKHLPFLLESSDQLLTLIVGHQELLAVTLILLLDLHLAHQVVLVLDLVLNLGHVLGHCSVVFLLKVVLLGVGGQLGGSEDVLNGVGDNKVLVGDEAVDGLLVTLGDGSLRDLSTFKFGNFFLVNEDGVTGLLLGERVSVRLKGTLGSTEGG